MDKIQTTKTITGVKIKMETFKAYLLQKGTVEAWVPKSQIKDLQTENEKRNDRGQLVDTDVVYIEIPEWLVNKGNLKALL